MRTPSRRSVGLTTTLLGVATLGVSLLTASAGAVTGPEVTPVLIPGAANSNCEDLDDANGGGQTWLELDFAPAESGQTKNGVTVTYNDDNTITFVSVGTGVDAVYVKSGSEGSNLYVYAPTGNSPESFGDDGLETPGKQAISHVSICYDTQNPPPPETTTTSTTVLETTTTVAPTTTTAQVLGTTLVRDPATTTSTTAAQVLGVQLARTGPANYAPLGWFGLGLIGTGLVLVGQHRRTRQL